MGYAPFEITKAVDFTDEEIESRFIRFGESNFPLLDPRSQVSQYLVGGKGGGRTHLMRHFAYQLQRERADNSVVSQLAAEGYLGIYLVASGLNGSRFAGHGLTDAQWKAVFANYFELWMCEQLLLTLADVQRRDECWTLADQATVSRVIASLLAADEEAGLSDCASTVVHHRRQLDVAINNLAFGASFNEEVSFNPGELIFTVSEAVTSLPGLEALTLTYMIDELENFTAEQQTFINTLLREKRPPSTFLLGAREWGVKTYATFSAGEINRRGSEFTWIVPEDVYRDRKGVYKEFCEKMVVRRLRQDGFDEDRALAWIERLAPADPGKLHSRQLLSVIEGAGVRPSEAKHLGRAAGLVARAASDPSLGARTLEILRFEGHPLLEKLAILKLYQDWSSSQILDSESLEMARAYIEPLTTDGASEELKNYLNLWKHDLIAQVYADYGLEVPYGGFTQLVNMSGYLPRSLLVTLRHISRLSAWRGERPFDVDGSVSSATQSAAVMEASSWYLEDVKPLGARGEECDRAVRRLGRLLRSVRYSDKPSEVSVTSFSSSMHGVSEVTLEVIDDCVKHRMLIEIDGGRAARNVGAVHRKYQLHPMIAPFFGLSLGRRGDLSLTGREVSAIFDPTASDPSFSAFAKRKILSMTAPFRRRDDETLF